MVRKASIALGALATLAGSTWGADFGCLRTLYNSIVLPRMPYCASAIYTPEGGRGYKMIAQAMLQACKKIHRRATQIISGGFRTVAASAGSIETLKHF